MLFVEIKLFMQFFCLPGHTRDYVIGSPVLGFYMGDNYHEAQSELPTFAMENIYPYFPLPSCIYILTFISLILILKSECAHKYVKEIRAVKVNAIITC